MVRRFIAWAVGSTYLKKHLALFGGFCLGYLFCSSCWREVNTTLAVWGIDKEQFRQALIAGAGVCGVLGSYGLSAAKTARDRRSIGQSRES